MLSVKFDFEAMVSAYAESLFELYKGIAAGDVTHFTVQSARDMILEEALNFEDDILTSVPGATNGAGEPILALTFDDRFKVRIAECALRRFDVVLV